VLFDFGGDPDYYVHTGIFKSNFYHWAVLQTLLITEEVVNKLPSDFDGDPDHNLDLGFLKWNFTIAV